MTDTSVGSDLDANEEKQMMKSAVLVILTFMSTLSPLSHAGDDVDILRMSPVHRQHLFHYLENNMCSCGCGMTIAQCLHEDPTCSDSLRMAKEAIREIQAVSQETASPSTGARTEINSSQNGSVVSGQLDGKECTFASAGGTTIKLCD